MSESRLDPSQTDDDETPLESTVEDGMTILILTVAFGLLAFGVPWFWVVFIVGFGGLLPMAVGLARRYERRQANHRTPGFESTTPTDEDTLETLRNRYARGEIDEAEFEQRVETLLETESVDDAARYVDREHAYE